MKKFFENHSLIIGIILVFITLFVVGGLYSSHVIEHRVEELTVDEERYYDAVDLLSLEYNFDLETLGSKTYIATFTYEGETYKTYVSNTFCFVEVLEGDSLDFMVYSAVKHHAEQEKLIQNTAYITSYEASTRTLVIEAQGFHDVIVVEMVLNETYDGIVSYVVTSHESYNSEYNGGYTGGAVPSVENQMMDQYMSGATEIDTVAGASQGTGDAMIELIALLNLFLDTLEGGN